MGHHFTACHVLLVPSQTRTMAHLAICAPSVMKDNRYKKTARLKVMPSVASAKEGIMRIILPEIAIRVLPAAETRKMLE